MRYKTLILVKVLQKYQRSKLEVEKKSTGSALGMGALVMNLATSATSFLPLTWTCYIFAAPSQKSMLIPHLNMYFIFIWSQKPKTMVWLLAFVILAQSNLIYIVFM